MNPYYLRTICTSSTWQNLSQVKALNQCCASSETAKANAAAAAAAAVSHAMFRKCSVRLLAMMLWHSARVCNNSRAPCAAATAAAVAAAIA
eukprot:21192-Heterococcus_DN1.PRE.1